MRVLDDPGIRRVLLKAWADSKPGTSVPREQGGFFVVSEDGSLHVESWPQGESDTIVVPDHTGGMFNGLRIVASFHTHPNTGVEYQQEPSLTDIRAVRDDPDLRHEEYEGEFVISQEFVYLIRPDGTVESIGATRDVLF